MSTVCKVDDTLITAGLQIISEHAQMRGTTDNSGGKDLYHPNLLPRRQMFELLIDMISKLLLIFM